MYPSIVAGRMAGMMIQKEREEKCRSSSDLFGKSWFPSRSGRRRKKEGDEDALVE
jgi:hypothetical protein